VYVSERERDKGGERERADERKNEGEGERKKAHACVCVSVSGGECVCKRVCIKSWSVCVCMYTYKTCIFLMHAHVNIDDSYQVSIFQKSTCYSNYYVNWL